MAQIDYANRYGPIASRDLYFSLALVIEQKRGSIKAWPDPVFSASLVADVSVSQRSREYNILILEVSWEVLNLILIHMRNAVKSCDTTSLDLTSA